MSEYYAVQRSTDHLAHYGVKGMKWGVRKAQITGNDKALDRHFRKAARKLKKLQDIGLRPSKYAAKSAAYGVAAVGTGTIAIGGTNLLSKIIRNKATGKLSDARKAELSEIGIWRDRRFIKAVKPELAELAFKSKTAQQLMKQHNSFTRQANKVDEWGKYKKSSTSRPLVKDKNGIWKPGEKQITYEKLSNNDKLRIGTGAAALGLAGMSALNSYRASHSQKYREKAYEFKKAMDEAFAGTKYEGKYIAGPKQKKRKKRG